MRHSRDLGADKGKKRRKRNTANGKEGIKIGNKMRCKGELQRVRAEAEEESRS